MAPPIVFFIFGIFIVAGIAMFVFKDRSKSSEVEDYSQIDSAEAIKTSIILNAIDDGVMLIDENDVIQLLNPAASRMTGWRQEEATGIDYKLVMILLDEKSQPHSDETSPFIKSANQKETIHDTTSNMTTRSKKTISVDITVTPLFDDQEDFHGYIAVFRDVSEQRKADEEKNDFISTASHEMRTPVAAIEGYLALALNQHVCTIDNKARGFLNRAHENSKHLGKLFQDLLASTRADDGRIDNRPETVDIGALLQGLVTDLEVLATAKNIGVEYMVGDKTGSSISPLYRAHVDPNRIKEAITNLLDNAMKYTENGKISIGLTGDDSVIQISIHDTGSGIAPENINHLFQKFYRVDNTSTRTIGGTGLGLFISKKIIELYSGRIWVESELGKGSTFYVNIPRLSNEQIDSPTSDSNNDSILIQPTTKP